MQNSNFLNYLRRNSTFFLFLSLAFFSAAFFVKAESDSSSQSIFTDSDQDNLSNDEEKLYGTDENNKDSDGDGYSDGVEVESGYNPLIPAPGDKLVADSSDKGAAQNIQDDGSNLTTEVSAQIASVIKNVDVENKDVSLEDVNSAVQEILSGTVPETVLPEVEIKDIKIKKPPSKNLKEKERKEQERQDVLEYLTTMSYLIANNSPSDFNSEDEFSSMLGSFSDQSVIALASGNTQYLDSLSEKGQKILDETKDIEVPATMLDVHVKALKMAKYAQQLKTDLKPDSDDPLGQIATLSKLQGLLGVVADFSDEVHGALEKYDIEEIPLDI